jgi:hypothetical protein
LFAKDDAENINDPVTARGHNRNDESDEESCWGINSAPLKLTPLLGRPSTDDDHNQVSDSGYESIHETKPVTVPQPVSQTGHKPGHKPNREADK